MSDHKQGPVNYPTRAALADTVRRLRAVDWPRDADGNVTMIDGTLDLDDLLRDAPPS